MSEGEGWFDYGGEYESIGEGVDVGAVVGDDGAVDFVGGVVGDYVI